MNERIVIDFTHKPGMDTAGKRDSDVMGDRPQACGYARLLHEQGYTVHAVTDRMGQAVNWRK